MSDDVDEAAAVVRLRERLARRRLPPSASEIEPEWRKWLPAIAPKTFTAPFEGFHADFLDWYWPLLNLRAAGKPVPEETPRAGLLILGRGLGKSTILEAIALAEGARTGRSFGVYISSTEEKAGEHLASIRDLIESSEVARWYPGLAKPRIGKFGNQRGWRAEAVYTASGFAVVAVSLEKGIRGLRDSEIRPTFILLDDIDERDDSLVVKQEKFDTIRFDALPMLAKDFGVVIFAQNLIYAGSIAEDTVNRKLDWFAHRHLVGPVNTFQDDLEIEKRDGRPIIVAGTPNWSHIGVREGQALLDLIGEEALYRECQNKTAPPAEKLVWTGFTEAIHVITWSQFASVFKTNRIPSHWNLYGGFDAGTTGPERHPAVFSVAAVAAENSPLAGDVFVFYEFVAEAGETEDDMAKAMLLDLPRFCESYAYRQAAVLVEKSYQDGVSEAKAWGMRSQAGGLIPWSLFRGSHEAASERRTLAKWGLPVASGKFKKTDGLSQLRFYLKAEPQPHPFKAGINGRPNLYLVVADDQARAARDRYGLERHRWEAANLKTDPNVTARDVPMKFGDDATDAVKFYLAHFTVSAAPKTTEERVEDALEEHLKAEHVAEMTDGRMMARQFAMADERRKIEAEEVGEWGAFWEGLA